MKIKLTNYRFLSGKRLLFAIMKTFILLICTTVFSLNVENTFSQEQVTIDTDKTVSVDEVFDLIQNQTKYRFLYPEYLFANAPKVQLKKGIVKISELLKLSFSSNNIKYELSKDNVIVIAEKSKGLAPDSLRNNNRQGIQVSGSVTDINGQPLVGASILEKGTSNGTSSDFDGNFKLTTSNENAILVVSYLGFVAQEIPLNGKSQILVELKEDATSLNEVVLIGYGSVKKRDLTGSITSLNTKEVNDIPSGDVSTALQGKVSGVVVQQATGRPGRSANILIRGANSLTPGRNDPLYVVDGMIDGAGFNINMNDVKSIEVLKDASATAIYGSRGANGVILITTKRGQAGKVKVTYEGYTGIQSVIKKLDFLNAAEYKQYYIESRQNATSNTTLEDDVINSNVDNDWFDQIFRNSILQNHTVSVSGGTERSKFYTSINYFGQDGIIRNSDFSRLSLRFNGDHKISEKIKFSETISLVRNQTRGLFGDESVSNGAAWGRPTLPVLDSNGDPTRILLPFARTNPRSLIDNIVSQGVSHAVLANLTLDYEIIDGLTARIRAGANLSFGNNADYTPLNLSESSFRGRASKSSSIGRTLLNENTLNYKFELTPKHSFDVLAGVTFQQNRSESVGASSSGFIVDDFEYNNLRVGVDQFASSGFSESALISYLGRVNYTCNNKYFLTLSGRYDGSSVLAEGNEYAFFPSGALAWIVSEEPFLKSSNVISNLKLRATWGETGSQSISPYSSFATLGVVNVYTDGGTEPLVAYRPNRVANNNLEWERTTQVDFGVDLSLFKGKINLTVDYYKKNTTGLLFNRQTPPSSGFTSSLQNIGEVENKGFEFSLDADIVRGNDFNWNTNFNISTNRAKVVDLGKNPAGEVVKRIVTGVSGGSWFPVILGEVPYQYYGNVVESVDLQTGVYNYADITDDGVVNGDDRRIIGNFQPDYTFGFTNSFSYRNFDFSVFLTGSVGNDLFGDAFSHTLALNGNNNILRSVYEGVGTQYPIPNADYSNSPAGTSDALVFDGSYIRFRTISLGYNLPESVSGSMKIRLYLKGTNLITISDYPWYDPAASAGSELVRGWDRGGYPNNKAIILGINVKL